MEGHSPVPFNSWQKETAVLGLDKTNVLSLNSTSFVASKLCGFEA